MGKEFGIWLRKKIKETGKTQAEVSSLIGVEQPQLSRILSGERGASIQVLKALARVLNIPDEQVFAKAGVMDEKPERNQKIDQITHLLYSLNEENLEELLRIVKIKQELEEKQKGKSSRSKRPARNTLGQIEQ